MYMYIHVLEYVYIGILGKKLKNIKYIKKYCVMLIFREHGQGTVEELRNRDFRKELEDRERTDKDKGSGRRAIEPSRESTASSAKRQKIDQVPAASLDADDPLDDEESDSDSDEDDTAALLAELQRIKKERAAEQAKKVSIELYYWLKYLDLLSLFSSYMFYI